jgi:hypothetical protein
MMVCLFAAQANALQSANAALSEALVAAREEHTITSATNT